MSVLQTAQLISTMIHLDTATGAINHASTVMALLISNVCSAMAMAIIFTGASALDTLAQQPHTSQCQQLESAMIAYGVALTVIRSRDVLPVMVASTWSKADA